MYAKVFAQIFDSSIADNYPLRHFFMDLLVLADCDGVVDMTPTAIAARTRIPLPEVTAMLAALEQPDHESRTPDHDGRRIARLDDHRTWGWCIINYDKFRKIAREEQRREKTRLRTLKWREKTACDAPVTHGDAGDAMQMQKHSQIVEREKGFSETPPMSRKAFDELVKIRGVPPDCAEWFWNTNDARNWRDATGQPIRKVEPILLNVLKSWQAKKSQGNFRNGKPQLKPDHEKGF